MVISAGQRARPPPRVVAAPHRTARAGLRGRSRRSGVPGTETHDTGPGSSTDGGRRGSFYSGARDGWMDGGGIHHLPSRSGNQSLEMHKHNGQQHGLQCKETAFLAMLNEWRYCPVLAGNVVFRSVCKTLNMNGIHGDLTVLCILTKDIRVLSISERNSSLPETPKHVPCSATRR